MSDPHPCPRCDGTGQVGLVECENCNGCGLTIWSPQAQAVLDEADAEAMFEWS